MNDRSELSDIYKYEVEDNDHNLLDVDPHENRYELQYIFIPRLVAAINDGDLPSLLLYKIEDWAIWEAYTCEKGCDVKVLDVDSNHKLILYTFPEPNEIPEALYGAVLINSATNKAEYYTLEYGWEGTWIIGSKTLGRHYNYGDLKSRKQDDFVEWVVNRIEHKE